MKMSKATLTAGVPIPSVGKNSGKSRVNGCGNLRLTLGQAMQGAAVRDIEWAPPKEASPVPPLVEDPVEEYGPWQWAAAFGRATGRFGAEDFTLQEDGKLRCPAGASLWLSEVRQENAFTEALPCISPIRPIVSAVLFGSNAWPQVQRGTGLVVSVPCVVFCPHRRWLSTSLSHSDQYDGWMSQAEHFVVPGQLIGALNMSIIPLAHVLPSVSPPPRPPRAVRSRHRWNWRDRLAHNAWWGPPQLRITVAGVPAFLAGEEKGHKAGG